MSHFISIEANRKALQAALIAAGFTCGPTGADGVLGAKTADAVIAYRTAKNLTPLTALIDAKLLTSLNLTTEPIPMANATILSGLTAQAGDYFANFISSKIVWVSGIVVVALDTWVSSHWGLQVPDTVNGWVTAGIATVGGALVMWLRTFANTPKVIAGTTVRVQK